MGILVHHATFSVIAFHHIFLVIYETSHNMKLMLLLNQQKQVTSFMKTGKTRKHFGMQIKFMESQTDQNTLLCT